METEIICPDCGRPIVPVDSDIDPAVRCRCAERDAKRSPPAEKKHCYVCGADLSGRKRLRDHLGRYWCADCEKAERRVRRRARGMRCHDCHRRFPAGKLIVEEGVKLCHRCQHAREIALKTRLKEVGLQGAQRRYEFGVVKWLGWLILALLALAALQWLIK